MGTMTDTIDVDVDVTTAYNQWTQFEEFPEFMMAVEEVRQISDDTLHWVTKAGPIVREYDAVITEQVPDQVIAWKSVSGTDNSGRVSFQPLGDRSTQITLELTVDPEGFVETVGDATGAIDAMAKSDLRRFKELIENRGAESGAWRGEIGNESDSMGAGTTDGMGGAGTVGPESSYASPTDGVQAGPDSPLGTGDQASVRNEQDLDGERRTPGL